MAIFAWTVLAMEGLNGSLKTLEKDSNAGRASFFLSISSRARDEPSKLTRPLLRAPLRPFSPSPALAPPSYNQ